MILSPRRVSAAVPGARDLVEQRLLAAWFQPAGAATGSPRPTSRWANPVLVLSQMAGLDEHIAGLTAGDVVIADGAATITAPTGAITLPASSDGSADRAPSRAGCTCWT